MRIALITDAWEPIVGGGQTHIWALSTRLVKQYGYEVDIFTRSLTDDNGKKYDEDETYLDGRLRIFRSGPTTSFFDIFGRVITLFTIAMRLLQQDQIKKYDVIHAHVFLGAIVGKIVNLFTHIPIILTVHGTNLTDINANGFSVWLEKQICFQWSYDHVIAVGQGYKKYQNVNKNISVIPNGVNIEAFDSRVVNKSKDFTILFVGRLEWTKGVDTLIDAIALINKSNIKLHIVGYGYDKEKYVEQVKKNKLENIVTFKGMLLKDDLIKEYKKSSLFVLSSRSEGDSITVKEAWAAELPVIATRSGGPEYYIDDGVGGWLVDKENPKQLADKIIEVLQMSKEEREKMCNAGRKKVEKQFTWEIAAKKTDEVYKKAKA